mgnify:CR=1 FL=1
MVGKIGLERQRPFGRLGELLGPVERQNVAPVPVAELILRIGQRWYYERGVVEVRPGEPALVLAPEPGETKERAAARVHLVVPDKMSTEKVLHLKALGAEVHITRSDVGKGHPAYYQDVAQRLASEVLSTMECHGHGGWQTWSG